MVKERISQGLMVLCVLFLAYFWAGPQIAPAHHERKKVRFWHMWTAEWKDVVDKIVKRYNDSQDVYEVEALSVPGGGDSKFILGVLGGDPPDVMAQWNAIIPPWADGKLLRPLDELMTPADRKKFYAEAYPVVKKLGIYKGKLYGMSIGINMNAVYYLPDQLKAAGMDPGHLPQTLEELTAAGKKLNQFDSHHSLTRLGWMPSGFPMFSSIFGGSLYNWKTGQLTIDTAANRRALGYIGRSNAALGYDNVLRFNSGLDKDSSAGGWPFIAGAYTFVTDGQWRVQQIAKFAPGLKYGTFPVPPPAGGRKMAGFSGGNFMIVPFGGKQPEGAWDFIKFWSGLDDPDVASEFYTWGGWLPLTPEVANAPIYREYLRKYPQFKTFVDLMPSENEEVLPPVPYQTFLQDHLTQTEESVARGTLSADKALIALSKTIANEVQRRKDLGYDR